MDPRELMLTAARAAAVYALLLIVIRALGKRTVGNFAAFDLLVALMLGEVVDEIIYGDVTFLQGTIAIVTIGTLAFADSALTYASRPLRHILEGNPAVMIRHGELQRGAMRAEHLGEMDIAAMLRLRGVSDRREVALAVLETDGELSVLKEDWAEPARKADIDKGAASEKEDALDLQDQSARATRTDSPEMLGEAA